MIKLELINEEFIRHMKEVVEDSFKKMPSQVVCGGSMNEFYGELCAVYTKARDSYIFRLFQEIGLYSPNAKYEPKIQCYEGYLTASGYSIKDFCFENVAECEFMGPGQNCFWRDEFQIDGGYERPEDLTSFFFSEDGVEQFWNDDLEIPKTVSKEWCEKTIPDAFNDIKDWWKTPYQEEMALALIPHIKGLFADNFDDEVNFVFEININVAIKPFLDALKKDHSLRKDPASSFAVTLIKELRFCQHYQPYSMDNIDYGYTDNLFFNAQGLGTGYEDGLANYSLSVKAMIAFQLIDYVLIYLDQKYNFLSENIKEFYLKDGEN